jgi:RimJ/RimL family protein N-acetyltransferase
MTHDSTGGRFRLVPCGPDGRPAEALGPLPQAILDLNAMSAEFYGRTVYQPPWVGYLAVDGGEVVGTGGFVGPPVDGRVEIAYGTLPEHEGRGHAGRTAAALVAIARAARPGVELYAKTLPEDGPSPAILRRLGFRLAGTAIDHEIGLAWAWRLAPEWRSGGAQALP